TQQLCIYKPANQTSEPDFLKDIMSLGFIRGLVRSRDDKGYEGQGEFLHLTLQEYFAAWFIVHHWQQSPDKTLAQIMLPNQTVEVTPRQLLQTYKYNPRFTLVWPFVAGLLGQIHPSHVDSFAAEFEALPIDLLSVRHHPLILRCLEELPDVSQIPAAWQEFVSNLQEIIQQWAPDKYYENIKPQNTVLAVIRNSSRWNRCYVVPLLLEGLLPETKEQDIVLPRRLSRIQSLAILKEIGSAAVVPETLSALAQCLQDSSESVQKNALETVGQLGSCAATEKILAELVRYLRNDSEEIRRHTAKAVGRLGKAAVTPKFLAALALLLRDSYWYIREIAMETVSNLGAAAAVPEFLAQLVQCLHDNSVDIRLNATKVIGKLGAAAAIPEILSALAHCLQDNNADIRRNAINTVGNLGESAATAEFLMALDKCMRDSREYVRESVVYVMRWLGAAATPEFLMILAQSLRDNRTDVRSWAAYTVGRIGAAAATPEFLAQLVQCLHDSRDEVRISATTAVRYLRVAAATEEILSALAQCLQESNDDIRSSAANAVGELGAAAATPEILSALAQCLRGNSKEVQKAVTFAVGRLGAFAATPEILSALAPCLESGSEDVRWRVAAAVGNLGVSAANPEILLALVKCLRVSNKDVYMMAAIAMGALGAAAATPEILSKLAQYLRDNNEDIRNHAAYAVGELGEAAATPEILSALAQCLQESNDSIRISAASAVGKLGTAAAIPEVLSALAQCFYHNSEAVRISAANAVLTLSAATPEFLKMLLDALNTLSDAEHNILDALCRFDIEDLANYSPALETMLNNTYYLERLSDQEKTIIFPSFKQTTETGYLLIPFDSRGEEALKPKIIMNEASFRNILIVINQFRSENGLPIITEEKFFSQNVKLTPNELERRELASSVQNGQQTMSSSMLSASVCEPATPLIEADAIAADKPLARHLGASIDVKGRVRGSARSISFGGEAAASTSKESDVGYLQSLNISSFDPSLSEPSIKALYEKVINNVFYDSDPAVKARQEQVSFLQEQWRQTNLSAEDM
ncbi:MAG: HEAT repeat domain-containing protein, partial [Gammaproteobacteria bacterium]